MDTSSFLTSLLTSFLIFVVLVLLFLYLSQKPGNEVVYFPNRILKGLEPREGSRGPFAWVRGAFGASEQELVDLAGLDAAVYIVFLGSVLAILVFSGLILLPMLLSVNATDNYIESSQSSQTNFTSFDKLSMSNIAQRSNRMWAHLLAVYWVSLVTFYILWKAYKHVSELRTTALTAAETKPERFAVLVRDIPPLPPGQTRKEQVDSYFRQLHPDSFYRSLVVTDNKEANKIWQELENYKKKLAHAEAVFAENDKVRPKHRTGFLGLIGQKVDTIEFCNQQIKELTPKLEAEQKTTLKEKQLASAIVFFNSWPAAVSASQTIHSQPLDKWSVMAAPEPRELLWENLSIPFFVRLVRQYAIYVIVFFTIFFYMIPITFISAFTTLANLRKYLPFLKPIVDQAEIKTVLEAYLPQIALLVFLAILPMILLALSKLEGIPSLSHAIRATSGKYFYFTVLNVFIGVTLASGLFKSFKQFVKHANTIVPTLGKSLPGSTNFFITYVALKFFVGYGLELSRLVPLILYHLKRRFLCKTDAELKEAWAPGDFNYATKVPNDMLITTVVLCYSVIAPVIIPFGVLYFAIGWVVLRNQALKVYVPSYESYGRMWPHIHTRILASLVLFQITMIGYLGVKYFYKVALLIPLPILSVIFGYICSKRFYQSFAFVPLEIASQQPKQSPNLEAAFEAYVPPCLSTEKFEDIEQYEDARSEVSRTASAVYATA
ncbi:CSC1-like protein [Nymphaea thermarum]|nr:CSC1-like protein [Nymphaea thermarum]